MKPPKREFNYEKVIEGDFQRGTIADIEYDEKHKFTFQGTETIAPAVRIVFELDGYKFPHRSRWMKFNYGEKSNLYNKYLLKLVEGAKPDMDFDLDGLKGMRVKTLWASKGEFQNLESIFPLDAKVSAHSGNEPEEAVDLGEEEATV